MVKIILVGIIVALVYSQPDLRLTVADWLKTASDFLIESVKGYSRMSIMGYSK